jgi:acyl carrier protein
MTKQDIFDGLKEIISVMRPGTDLSTVDYDTELVRDLGIDSLFMILLSLAAEQKFNMRFPDGQAAPTTVGGVCDAVLKALEA